MIIFGTICVRKSQTVQKILVSRCRTAIDFFLLKHQDIRTDLIFLGDKNISLKAVYTTEKLGTDPS